MTPSRPTASYRALLAVPHLGRLLVSMQLARIAGEMVSVALVLFTLARYHSPTLAGVVTFAAVFPGLAASPVAGALLDRHGRVRLIALDYAVAATSLVLIGGLSLADRLPPPLLVLIAGVSSITSILSHTGLRSLFPLIVPIPLWERVNAVDSNGYVVATILGPPVAAALVATVGAPLAVMAIAIPFALAIVALIGVRDPAAGSASSGHLFRDAWSGVRYVWRNPTLRGLGIALSVLNLAWGMLTIVVPLVVLERLAGGETMVGLVFAASGVTGMVSAFLFGRLDTRDREWSLLVLPMLGMALATAMLLPAGGAVGGLSPGTGLILVAAAMGLFGFLNGPVDIALFTVRQRRTERAWYGRAFAVSMAFNMLGFPIGAALTGSLAAASVDGAIAFGVVAAVVAAALAAILVPRTAPDADPGPAEGLPVLAEP